MASSAGEHHEREEDARQLDVSRTCAARPPPRRRRRRAGPGRPARRRGRRPRSRVDHASTEIEPSRGIPSVARGRRSRARVLARHVGRASTSPSGAARRAGQRGIRMSVASTARPRRRASVSRAPPRPASEPGKPRRRPVPSARRPTFSNTCSPSSTTRRCKRRSLRELVRGAVGTALEFATLGEAPRLRTASRRLPAADPAHRGPAAPTAAHPHRRLLDRQPPGAGAAWSAPRPGLPHAGSSPGVSGPDAAAPGLGGRARRPARRSPRSAGLHRRSGRPTGAARVRRSPRANDDEPPVGRLVDEETGGDLLSQALASQVPSALWGLTALFGMGRGVSPTQWPPEIVRDRPPASLKTAQLFQRTGYQNPSSPRPISTGLLRALPLFQIRPINLVVYQGSYSF